MNGFYRTIAATLVWGVVWLGGCADGPQVVGLPAGRPIAQVQPQVQTSAAFPFPIVQLRGSSQQLGEQHGQQLSDSIHQLYEKYLLVFIGTPTKRFMALSAANIFESKLRPEHREEMHALAVQSQMDEREMMLGQCFLDLAQLSACSTIALPASAAPDHVARFGRNLDFVSLNIADKYTTLFIVRPDDGRYAYAAVGWPGMIGLLSGMNQYGLCLASMEVPRSPRFPTAMPYTLLYRTVLERCQTVQEAVELLQKTGRQTANNLMLMDASGARAVVEISPAAVHVRWGNEGTALISTNHQRDQDVDTHGRCDRYDFLHDASEVEYGQISRGTLQGMLRTVGGHSTLQSMVFEPANRVIYLAAGTSAATKTFCRLDLGPILSEGVRTELEGSR